MIVVETKLSQNTGLTTGQTLAQQQVGKGSLSYKAEIPKINDEIMNVRLPKSIDRGTQIPIKAFYKLYGDGKNTFKGITK